MPARFPVQIFRRSASLVLHNLAHGGLRALDATRQYCLLRYQRREQDMSVGNCCEEPIVPRERSIGRADQWKQLLPVQIGRRKGTVVILSSDGVILHEVELTGIKPTNITFGGPDGKTCYVTMMDRGNMESFRVEFPGREWVWYSRDE